MKLRNRSLLLAFAFSFFSFLTFAQNTHIVTGNVVDKDAGIPLEYATITFNDVTGNLLAQGGVTDFDGNFSIEVKEGTYNIVVEYISFQPKKYNNRTINKDINLGNIVLEINQNTLNEVVVRAETTEVDVRLDKKIYNIGKDLTTQGATVSDALNNVPSVTVDVEGGISLRGNENVRILINGKPSAMAGFGDTNIFQQLPADAIERVEVITSPSARYDAEGTAGILNIILKKEKTLGLNGSISANVGFPANSSISANLNLRTDKFNIFNTIGNYYRKSPGYGYFDSRYARTFFDADSIPFNREIEDREMDRRYQGFNNNFGIEYFLNDNSSLTGSFFFRYGDDRDVTENNTVGYLNDDVSSRIYREQIEEEKDNSYQASLNYMNKFNDEGHQLTADFQYSYDKEHRPTSITQTKTFPTNLITDSETIDETEVQNEFLLQADYVLPMGEAQFEAGFRSNYEEEELDYELREFGVVNDTLTNVFTYTENVNALYSQYGNKFGDFSFLLGLRLEQTIMKGDLETILPENTLEEALGVDFDSNFDKNFLGLFPTVNLIYELSEDENVTLGYNRRINRPRGWFINPFPSRSSATNIFQGNPDLDPAYSNFFDIGYLKKWEELTLTSSVYYQKETNSFERIEEGITIIDVNEDGTTTEREGVRTIPINLGSDQRIGAEIGAIYNPAKWLRLNASFNLFNSKTEGSYNGEEYGAENTTWFGRLSSKFELPAKIDMQMNGFYMGPQKNALTDTEGIFSVNLAMSKELVPNVLTASFNVSDLFNSRVRNNYSVLRNGTIRESEFQWRQRQFTLSVIYRFNQPNNERKKQREGEGENNGFGNGDENGGDF